jgi:hypothetical protein
MSREAFRIDSEMRGHTPAEVIRYLSDSADWEDKQLRRQRVLPMGVISPDGVEPRWLGRLRRLTGRG